MKNEVCCFCNCQGDLRNYGPEGQPICYTCASLPENIVEAERQFKKVMHEIEQEADVIVIGLPGGPRAATVEEIEDIIRLHVSEGKGILH